MTRTIVVLLTAAAIIVLGFALYSHFFGDHLNVTPDAAREIEKAKRR
jgi:hypothetical protein